ncbi:hypothetical protein Vadar_011634 [Vaccinium darrowii]|uniref:Uncharacterized protein n=1 Tax=Vaccinium darrowii TaxID=229202 RepID=A0ACB7ZL30_9ERIC|nr:hypothetical protein Vadar_011634 [Vaccinium darrowii]
MAEFESNHVEDDEIANATTTNNHGWQKIAFLLTYPANKEVLRDPKRVCIQLHQNLRPMASLILISEEMFTNLRAQILASKPVDQQQRLQLCFDQLMADITRSLETKNRDKFTQNLTKFRNDFRTR